MKDFFVVFLVSIISSIPGFLVLWWLGAITTPLILVAYFCGTLVSIMLFIVLREIDFKMYQIIIGIKSKFFDIFGTKIFYHSEKYFDVDQEKVEQWLEDRKIKLYWFRQATYDEIKQFELPVTFFDRWSTPLEEPFIYVYYFLRKKDAMMFKLVWGEK